MIKQQTTANYVALSLLDLYNPYREFLKGKHVSTPDAFMSFWCAIGASAMWKVVTTDMRSRKDTELGEIIGSADGKEDSLIGNSDRAPVARIKIKRQMGLIRGFAGNESTIPRPFGQWNGITLLRYYASLAIMTEIMEYCDLYMPPSR